MRRLLGSGICLVTVVLCACGGGGNGSESSGHTGTYLGSYISLNPAGATLGCVNFYGPAKYKSTLSSSFNRNTRCPTELALGACVAIEGTGATATEIENVYYQQVDNQGKSIPTGFEDLKDGDSCGTIGIWKKPYE